MRYVIKFAKEGDIKFISHLDLLRTIQKIIKRSGLPVEYSKGFNPHMSISIAQPLSVGMYSEGEYMDVVLVEKVDPAVIIEKLNKSAPLGIKIFDAIYVHEIPNQKNAPQTMAAIDAAENCIKIKYNDSKLLKEEMEKLLSEKEWVTLKKSKKGEKMTDIKPMVKTLSYSINDNVLTVTSLVSCGSRENLSAQLLAEYIQSKTSEFNSDAFVDIKRNEMYTNMNDKLVALKEYYRMIQ